MKIRDRFPELAGAPVGQLLAKIPYSVWKDAIDDIAEAYLHSLPMWLVMNSYGHDGSDPVHYPAIGPDSDQVQVSCERPGHENNDAKKSARYFAFDGNTGELRGHVFCYVCLKPMYAFWYVHKKLRDMDPSVRYVDVFRTIERRFGVPFPRDVLLDYDPEGVNLRLTAAALRNDPGRRFAAAKAIRQEFKEGDKAVYAKRLVDLYMAGSTAIAPGQLFQQSEPIPPAD